ncbi:hypothetical protein [Aeromonas allosaccharophila]|uniref:hypothetical protein n=1 Tax=Aeromonas allosaccharophila TaxID=656 RepID=UPI003D25377B
MFHSRNLIHYAFVHNEFSRTGDVLKGLLPLFYPIINKYNEKKFDPVVFCNELNELYGIEMNPYAAEELAFKLCDYGVLTKEDLPNKTCQFYFKYEIGNSIESSKSKEKQFEKLYHEFELFSKEILARVNLSSDNIDFPQEFSHRLARMENFTNELTCSGKTKPSDVLDYSFARYISRLESTESPMLNLLTDAYSGALFSEVVLNLHNPSESTHKISGKIFYIDANLIMDILGFNNSYAVDCSRKIIEGIRNSGGIITTTDYYIRELVETISAAIQNFKQRGPRQTNIDRHLFKNPTDYGRSLDIQVNPNKHLEKYGFELSGKYLSAYKNINSQRATIISQEVNEYLGEYKNSIAKDRDIETIKYILLNNGLKDIKRIDDCNTIFITTNRKMTFASTEYLLNNHIVTKPFFLPLLTDRRFAMLLWILTGGSQTDFSHLTLVSNCRKVVEQHVELFHSIKQFLTKIPPEQAKIYESIINNDRAIYSLMDQTGGNPTIITENNFDSIFSSAIDEIEREAKEEERLKTEIEINKIKESHDKEIRSKDETIEIYDKTINNISSQYENLNKIKTTIEDNAKKLDDENEYLKAKLKEKEDQLASTQTALENEQSTKLEKVQKRRDTFEKILTIIIVVIIMVVIWSIPDDGFKNKYFDVHPDGIKIATNITALFLTWKFPDYFIKPIIDRIVDFIYPIK